MPSFTGTDGIEQRTAVRKRALDDGTPVYDAGCTCGFKTAGWPRKKDATSRITEHQAEHVTGEAIRELVKANEEVGLTGPVRSVADIPIFEDEEDEGDQ